MTAPLAWTTTEFLANADAHTIEEGYGRTVLGTSALPGLLLRGMYEVDRDTLTVQRRSAVLYPVGTL